MGATNSATAAAGSCAAGRAASQRGDGAQAPAGRDGTRSGKGREQRGGGGWGGGGRGAFSPSERWELLTSRVMRSAHDTQDAACHITAPKGDFRVVFIYIINE